NTSFNLSDVRNSSYSDLDEASGLFDSVMYDGKDDPQHTFSCTNGPVFTILGNNFTGCYVTLKNNIKVGLLKYYYGGSYFPLYIVDSSSYSCYDGSNCNYEFMLPLDTYYFYYVSKEPMYAINVWIDGQQTTHFSQTALPYIVKLRVTNYFTHESISNVTAALVEDNGNNIFVPWRLNGIVSRAMTTAKTDSDGSATFVAAPTKYGTMSSYSFIQNDQIIKSVRLYVDHSDSTEYVKKPIQPSVLLDNAKVSVNAMNQITNSLYIWANSASGTDSPQPQAVKQDLTVYTNGSYTPITLQTGAPNVIDVTLKEPSGVIENGYINAEENDGYLVMNPTYNQTTYAPKKRVHEFFWIPTTQEFIVTPTSYGQANSIVSLKVYDSYYNLVANVKCNVIDSFEPRNGVSYNNDNLKVIINSMNSVLNSLYYSMN
ncbi:MAG: hypothetical protein GWP09_02440, partial [Nitrospiraceae bacterium]|nr:hypothetical protein [Nitrospiraceae bacterium]